MARPQKRGRLGLLLVVVVLAMVNLPLLHSTWLDRQVDRSGVDVTARVADETVQDGRSYVGFVLPEEIDGEQVPEDERGWTVQVEDDVRVAAAAAGEITVRVLPDQPSAFAVDGEIEGSSAWVYTGFANLAILAGAVLLWRFRRALRPHLVLAATGDVERCAPGALLERVDGDEYVVRGEVESLEDDGLVLLVGERRVVVELHGHANPVGHQQSAQVRGRMIG
jgi:hypothetical protein